MFINVISWQSALGVVLVYMQVICRIILPPHHLREMQLLDYISYI